MKGDFLLLQREKPNRAKLLAGSSVLQKLKSVVTLGKEKGESPLPENESATAQVVVALRRNLGKEQVREGRF